MEGYVVDAWLVIQLGLIQRVDMSACNSGKEKFDVCSKLAEKD